MHRILYLHIKSFIDFIVAITFLILISPFLVFIYFLILCLDRINPIFTQRRIGKNGLIFKLFKFRTMRTIKNDKNYYVSLNDKRVTRLGFLLRLLSIDELLQLINIVKGDMSFIGPRPSIEGHPYFAYSYPKELKLRLMEKPGITGLAQVSGRNKLSNSQKYVIDLKYVSSISFLLDLKILFKTPLALFDPRGIFE